MAPYPPSPTYKVDIIEESPKCPSNSATTYYLTPPMDRARAGGDIGAGSRGILIVIV